MGKFKKRINIENATSFKLEYLEGKDLKSKEFNTYKAMEQFHARQRDFSYLDLHRYAFVENKWHRFIKLRSLFVFEKEIEFINKIFNENIEVENPQIFKNEE
ncbi:MULTISPECIES: hypothetical protein [Chryseobacterium]|uniref:Uncharacterized protein n=1 Tax=Candidatus Chryseobacterium massiliense TaxID=204089 RepID=A0A3D9B2H8_9FLAO|nr:MULTISPECIES: hypothetical protein [Chryseobacterium]REC47850.1 hypothetical protein DRF68_12475 [Candidatus Chryseobacterium massiliae]